ncbi:MAG TPA: putative Ig domain-containing protein [Candidatus Acidoferrales bacterium]|nr:putative Ig domain-containing protein [Candidatus Acidoferrales bacterium]
MQKRAGSCLAFLFLLIACLQVASCTGTPPLFDTVILRATSRQVGPNTQVTITAQVPQDETNAGVTWVLMPPTPPPADFGTLTTTLTEAIYTSPVTVPSKFTVTIQATSIAIPSETNSITITIVPPQTLKITTKSPLAPGTEFVAYPDTQLQATGGVTPYAWSLANGSTLPTGLSLSPAGVISGTPTVTGTFNFSVQVTDSEVPPVTTNPPTALSITITNLLNGNYVFELSGFNAGGAVALAGSFSADGVVTLTNGVEDFNSTSGAPKNQNFTGTFTLQNNNTGTLTFTSLAGSPSFAFSIDSTGSHGRIIEDDSSGIRGSGQIEKMTVNACASNTLSGQYAFGLSGEAISTLISPAGPVVIVGSVGATPPVAGGAGTLGPGESDANTPGLVTTQDQSLNGNYQTSAQPSRCIMSLSEQIGTLNFAVYPISSSEAFVVETDQVSASEPYLTSGKLLLQSGYPFQGVAGSSFTGTSVGGLTGQFLSGNTYIPDMALVWIAGTSSPNYTISLVENRGGTIGQVPPTGVQFTTTDSFGRTDSGIASPIAPIFYVIGANEAFAIGEILNDPFFGLLEPQSGSPFTASQFNETNFALGTGAPATAPVTDLSGQVALANTSTTAGTINGTEVVSASTGNSAPQAVTGNYSSLSSTTGSGIVTLTAPATFSGDFLVVSPTKIVILSTTSGDANPVLIYLGNCASTCNED